MGGPPGWRAGGHHTAGAFTTHHTARTLLTASKLASGQSTAGRGRDVDSAAVAA